MINILNVVSHLKVLIAETFELVESNLSDLETERALNLILIVISAFNNCEIKDIFSLVKLFEYDSPIDEDKIDRECLLTRKSNRKHFLNQLLYPNAQIFQT